MALQVDVRRLAWSILAISAAVPWLPTLFSTKGAGKCGNSPFAGMGEAMGISLVLGVVSAFLFWVADEPASMRVVRSRRVLASTLVAMWLVVTQASLGV